MKILLLGAPGAGKGTQAKKLAAKYSLIHLAPGDILREEVKNETKLGKEAKKYMDNGQLVPNELIVDMMLKKISEAKNVILDGFPRNLGQAEALDKFLSENDDKLDYVFNIAVSDEEIIRRLSSRRVCPKCGASYNLVFNPPKKEGVCDYDGEKLVQRKDDTPETIKKRLNVYREHTEPLIDFYKSKGILIDIPGEGEVEEIFNKITENIKL